MSRPALEVADIFRDRGPAWRRANAGHVSLEQLKVMSAIENCRTAALDRRHHLQLAEADMAGVGSAPCRAMIAEDIRDLQCRTRHARRALSGRLGPLDFGGDMLQRTHHLADGLGGDARIERRAIEPGVPEQHLDHSDIDVLFEQVGGEAVP